MLATLGFYSDLNGKSMDSVSESDPDDSNSDLVHSTPPLLQ